MNMSRTKKVKALYALIKLANKAKDLQDYNLANLTFGLAISYLEDDEMDLIYEDAGDSLSAYYDLVSIILNDRSLCIPAPLLNKDTLAECLKKAKRIDRLEHTCQFKDIDPADKVLQYSKIVSRYLKILRNIDDVERMIETALWVLDLPKGQKEAFNQWCFEFLTEPNTAQKE